MGKPITAVLLGAGNRGSTYSNFAWHHPTELEVIAVAEPQADRRAKIAGLHDIPVERQFTDWRDALAVGKMADVVINCTMDRTHMESTVAALNAGYDMLLEKPMSPILHENVRLVQLAEEKGRLLQICHVLRYSPFFQKVREIVQSGRLGRVVSMDHRENLIYWHMAHSYVRGNWRNSDTSGPMILAKCCHDLDILYWILRQPVTHLNSFGTLTHFKPENAPEGAPLRCTDGCPAADVCKYYAPRIYATADDGPTQNALTLTRTVEARLEALKTSVYGRCVYHCDNNVVDHQTVNMERADGTTVALLMNGQGYEEGRTLRIDGTRATLLGKFRAHANKIVIHDHLTDSTEYVDVPDRDQSGHGGGDWGVVRSFVNAMRGTPDDSLTTARESLESHLLAFAAEESRLQHTTINMPEYRARVEAEARQVYQQS
jgi:predicted dehydrogenase